MAAAVLLVVSKSTLGGVSATSNASQQNEDGFVDMTQLVERLHVSVMNEFFEHETGVTIRRQRSVRVSSIRLRQQHRMR